MDELGREGAYISPEWPRRNEIWAAIWHHSSLNHLRSTAGTLSHCWHRPPVIRLNGDPLRLAPKLPDALPLYGTIGSAVPWTSRYGFLVQAPRGVMLGATAKAARTTGTRQAAATAMSAPSLIPAV